MPDATIEIVEGPAAGQRTAFDGPLEIGRGEGVGLRLDDEQVSRRHARLSPHEGGAVVEDLGSRNGTFINGHQIYVPTQLGPSDQLQIGVSLLELRTVDEVARGYSGVQPIPAAFRQPERKPDYMAPLGTGRNREVPELDPLLDTRVKARARLAPLALFALAALVVLIFLAQR